MKTKSYTVLFLFLSLLSACSIKENRMYCPAYIHPAAENIPETGNLLVTVKTEEGLIFQDIVDREEFESEDFLIKVPRGDVILAVTAGIEGMYLRSDDVLSAEKGNQSDKLYSYSRTFHVSKERETLSDVLEKQHTFVYISLLGSTDVVSLSVNGDWSGMNAMTMSAVRGQFLVDITESMRQNGEYVYCMSRQGDYSMTLIIREEGKDDSEINIGSLMRNAGYLIDNDVLSDIHIAIDLSRGTIAIKTKEWGEVIVYEIIRI